VEKKVRRVQWRKRVGKKENDTSKTGISLKENHIMGCSSHKGVVFMCSSMSLVSSDVCICQVPVFQQILKCYRNVTNQQNYKCAKSVLSPRISSNRSTRKQGLCWNTQENDLPNVRQSHHVSFDLRTVEHGTDQASASLPRRPLSN